MKPKITIFITKNYKFRARVEEENRTYEVTVGGAEWKKGKGNEYRFEILNKCLNIISGLNNQILKL